MTSKSKERKKEKRVSSTNGRKNLRYERFKHFFWGEVAHLFVVERELNAGDIKKIKEQV